MYKLKKRKVFTLVFMAILIAALSACSFVKEPEYSDINRPNELSDKGLLINSSEESSDVLSISMGSESSAVSSETQSKVEYSQPEVSYDPNEVQLVNGIIIAGTRAMEQYGGGVKSAATYAGYLNNFKKAVGENINVYSMPIPLAAAFYAPEKYKGSVTNHEKTFASLRDNLNGVKDVNLLSVLSTHIEEQIYSRTDHHWQALGAYYAAKELASVAGVPFKEITEFDSNGFSGFVGSFYGYTKSSIIKNNPEDFVYYEPKFPYTAMYYNLNMQNPTQKSLFFPGNSYSKFIGGDSYCVKITSEQKNGRKLVIFKDSYGNALAPFVVGSFEEIYIFDIRYYKFDAMNFIKSNGITDVCFSLSAFSIVNSNGARVKNMY